MTKNPFLNAIVAALYIILVASIMFYGTRMTGPTHSIVVPIAVLSLFTLSAAVMGYLFLYEPAQLYFSNNKKEAIGLFLKTVAVFAVITIVALAVLFLKVL